MDNFLNALETSLKTHNWYSVLFISLTLPDICGSIDEPGGKSGERTKNWFKKYLEPIYTIEVGPQHQPHTFLTGSDFYSLRCVYLHRGLDDISDRKVRVLDNFRFVQPLTDGIKIHLNQVDTTLLLQVDEFGKEILQAAKRWKNEVSGEPEKMEKLKDLLEIEFLDPSKGFSL